jgi:DNA-binding GntR family transcriptional regulator
LEPLAQELGTSVTPVREAMMILREQGFVELHPNRGFVVCEFSAKDVQDLFLIQSMIGSELAARAAQHIDDQALAAVEEIQTELETLAVGNTDGRAFERANDAFHAAVNESAASPRLVWLYNAALPLPKYFSTIPGWMQLSIADHRVIVDALRRRDVEASRAAMASHVQRAGTLLAQHLEAEGRWPDALS